MRTFLITMTLVAVVSDYLLHPFYPQFFQMRFGVDNPSHVGYYFAAICFMVMLAFPFWAYISKRIAELNILVFTQAIAGVLALCCFWTTSYPMFWLLSLVMVLFKGSYLLVYPYLLKIVKKSDHARTIGILSVVVHLGGILGAVIGGFTVDFIEASYIFLIMAAGDFIQMGMSAYILKSKRYATKKLENTTETTSATGKMSKGFILKIGGSTLLLYFSDFLIRPFFVSYWEMVSANMSKGVSGLLYAIPGIVALGALWYNNKRNSGAQSNSYKGIISALALGVLGLLLQGIPIAEPIVLGRILYGWAIFQGVVKFDVLLFELSTPESYATDYSKVHFFQNLGVLFSSLSVGVLVEHKGLQIPFIVALSGFVLTLVSYYLIFKVELKRPVKHIVKPKHI